MKYDRLELYLSQARLDRFLAATDHSKTKAQQLYRINLRVAQSFYPTLNLFEIVLRNVINDQLTIHFANPNWIIAEKTGFMNHPTLKQQNYYLKHCIQKTEQAVRRARGVISPGKIVSEQTFGFWTCLFETHHYRLIGGAIIHCFPGKPNHVNRNGINQKLVRIRRFRNRVYHNEPICFHQNRIDFTEAIEVRNEIVELMQWIHPELVEYVDYFDGIDAKINAVNYL